MVNTLIGHVDAPICCDYRPLTGEVYDNLYDVIVVFLLEEMDSSSNMIVRSQKNIGFSL